MVLRSLDPSSNMLNWDNRCRQRPMSITDVDEEYSFPFKIAWVRLFSVQEKNLLTNKTQYSAHETYGLR